MLKKDERGFFFSMLKRDGREIFFSMLKWDERGLLLFVTACNFDKLLFNGPRGPGFIFYSLWDGGKGCTLIFFLHFLDC